MQKRVNQNQVMLHSLLHLITASHTISALKKWKWPADWNQMLSLFFCSHGNGISLIFSLSLSLLLSLRSFSNLFLCLWRMCVLTKEKNQKSCENIFGQRSKFIAFLPLDCSDQQHNFLLAIPFDNGFHSPPKRPHASIIIFFTYCKLWGIYHTESTAFKRINIWKVTVFLLFYFLLRQPHCLVFNTNSLLLYFQL